MKFYLVVHLLLGLFAGSMANLKQKSLLNSPKWVHMLFGEIVFFICNFGCLAAVITSFVKFSFIWWIATIGEIFLGAALSVFLKSEFKALAALLGGLVGVPIILGALWGFWYLG